MLRDAPECPKLAEHLWEYFSTLTYERNNTGFGVNRLTSSNIRDWCLMNAISLELWEIKALRKIDEAYLVSINKEGEE